MTMTCMYTLWKKSRKNIYPYYVSTTEFFSFVRSKNEQSASLTSNLMISVPDTNMLLIIQLDAHKLPLLSIILDCSWQQDLYPNKTREYKPLVWLAMYRTDWSTEVSVARKLWSINRVIHIIAFPLLSMCRWSNGLIFYYCHKLPTIMNDETEIVVLRHVNDF